MAVRMIRVVLDTNWYISATINKTSRRILYELLKNRNVAIVFSDEILKEYRKVILRDKFKKIITTSQVNRFMSLVIARLENVELKTELTGSRDQNDNFLLSLSYDGNADYLVTGDLDLLDLQQTGSTKILRLPEFLVLISHKAQ
jgi:uncharacterized protein